MRQAVIDIGTNSVKLLVAEKKADSHLETITYQVKITRLGEGLSQRGSLSMQPMMRTINVIKEFLKEAGAMRAVKTTLISTAAARVASNRDEFIKLVEKETHLPLKILSAEEEANLGRMGVSLEFNLSEFPGIIIDIGGGSTEITITKGDFYDAHSIPIGAVNLTEEFIRSDPPASSEWDELCRKIRKNLKTLPENFLLFYDSEEKNMIGVGGTITTIAAMLQKLEVYNPARIHRFIFSYKELEKMNNSLREMTIGKRKKLPGLDPGRADIIPAGAAILAESMIFLNIEKCTVSEYNLLHGIIQSSL